MFEKHGDDGPEHFEIIETCGVGAWIVGQEEPEEEKDEVLHGEGEPVDVTPGGVFCDDAGENTSDEDAEEETGDND